MTFMQRTARNFIVRKAVREIIGEIEKAGLDNLNALADAGKSIVSIYLKGCSPSEQARIRRDFNALLKLGITPDMVLEELTRQLTELAPIIESKVGYKKSEIEKVLAFLRGD